MPALSAESGARHGPDSNEWFVEWQISPLTVEHEQFREQKNPLSQITCGLRMLYEKVFQF